MTGLHGELLRLHRGRLGKGWKQCRVSVDKESHVFHYQDKTGAVDISLLHVTSISLHDNTFTLITDSSSYTFQTTNAHSAALWVMHLQTLLHPTPSPPVGRREIRQEYSPFVVHRKIVSSKGFEWKNNIERKESKFSHRRRWSFCTRSDKETQIPNVVQGVFLPGVTSHFRMQLWERIPGIRRRLGVGLFILNDDAALIKCIIKHILCPSYFTNYEDSVVSELCEYLLLHKSTLLHCSSQFFLQQPFLIQQPLLNSENSLDELAALFQAFSLKLAWIVYLFQANAQQHILIARVETKDSTEDKKDDPCLPVCQQAMNNFAHYVEINFSPKHKSLLQQDLCIETLFRILLNMFETDCPSFHLKLDHNTKYNPRRKSRELYQKNGSNSLEKKVHSKCLTENESRSKSSERLGSGPKLKFHKPSRVDLKSSSCQKWDLTSSLADISIVKNCLGSMAFLGATVVFPEAWKACFVAIRNPDTDLFLLNEYLKNILVLLVGSWSNVSSLVDHDENWSSWVLPILISSNRDDEKYSADLRAIREENHSLCCNLLNNILLQSFLHSAKFKDILRCTLRHSAQLGILHDKASNSLEIAQSLFENLFRRLSTIQFSASATSGSGRLNLASLLDVTLEFLFYSSHWTSTNTVKSVRLSNIFPSKVLHGSKSTTNHDSHSKSFIWTTQNKESVASCGLHTRDKKWLDESMILCELSMLRCLHGESRESFLLEEVGLLDGIVELIGRHGVDDGIVWVERALSCRGVGNLLDGVLRDSRSVPD